MARIHATSARFLALGAGALIVCLSVSAHAAEPPPWLEIHSPHFTIITDAGEKKGSEVALRFEQMRAVFATLLMKDRINQPVPLTIFAFKSDKTYYQTAPLSQGQPIAVPGFFLPGEDQDFIVLNLFEEESWRAVAHEFAHLLLNYNYPPAPGWFDEGLAEYFSSIRVDNRQVEIGGDPELAPVFTQDLLQNQHEDRNQPKSLTELLSGQVWLTLPDLLTMKHDTTNYHEGSHHTLFYAQAWMTMHYLLHEKKLPETGAYFNLVENQHVPVEEAVQQAYGMSAAQFDQAVKAYFHSLTPLFTAQDASRQPVTDPDQRPMNRPQVYQFPTPVGANDHAIVAKPLFENDAHALIDDVKIRIPERREPALQELHALATTPNAIAKAPNTDDKQNALLATGNETAHRVLAWDHIQHGEFDAATEELDSASVLNQHDMWIRYYLAVHKYSVAKSKHAAILGLPNMMQDLRAVLDWYPEFAGAYDLLAQAHTEGGGYTAAMQAERAAMQLSPRDQEFLYHLAAIYVADKKWDAARALLERLKTNANPKVAAEAREQLTTIATQQKYGIAPASVAAAQKLAPQTSPFDVLEQDAAKRAAQAKQASVTADKRPAKFVQGQLLRVDCSQAPAAVLTVAAAGGTVLKLRTPDYKSLLLMGADTFSCAWSNRPVSVNYKPGGATDGDLLSVEVR